MKPSVARFLRYIDLYKVWTFERPTFEDRFAVSPPNTKLIRGVQNMRRADRGWFACKTPIRSPTGLFGGGLAGIAVPERVCIQLQMPL